MCPKTGLIDLEPSIVCFQRFFDSRSIGRQIFVSKQSAVLFDELTDLARNLAAIKEVAHGINSRFAIRALF